MYAFQQSFSVPLIGTDRAEEAKAASGSLSEADVGMASANPLTARQPKVQDLVIPYQFAR